ncbi:DUF3800 domain-containing protein [bacterium]|nr:DUF3800 domain-containing protein [bacterium]
MRQPSREGTFTTPAYRIYIDEVGNADLESSEDPNHRFLSLTGVVVNLEYVRDVLHPEMEALKQEFFSPHPDNPPLILHRKEIMNANYPFNALKDGTLRKRFDSDFLAHLRSWQYVVITVCIDKKRHKKMYAVWTYDPYHYCLQVLLERYVFFLENLNSRGDAMAEARGGKADRRLKGSFNRLWEKGTDYVSQERFQAVLTSRELKVKPKKDNISGLQLADLIAHPSCNEILSDFGLLPRKIAPFARSVINILQGKYYRGPREVVYGWGKKLLPWRLEEAPSLKMLIPAKEKGPGF